jgi:hypothetical protein
MGRLLAVLLVVSLPAWPGEQPPGCAWLCGSWTLDAAQSDQVDRLVGEAMREYEEPRPGGKQPTGAQLQGELLLLLSPPASITLAESGKEILVRPSTGTERRFTPNRTGERTDALGTAEVRATWRSDDSLLISESYDRRRNQSESFALQRDGTLVVTREVERPGIVRLKVRLVYRRT